VKRLRMARAESGLSTDKLLNFLLDLYEIHGKKKYRIV